MWLLIVMFFFYHLKFTIFEHIYIEHIIDQKKQKSRRIFNCFGHFQCDQILLKKWVKVRYLMQNGVYRCSHFVADSGQDHFLKFIFRLGKLILKILGPVSE